MKKLMIAFLGLSLALTTVSLAQTGGQTETSKKKSSTKKGHKGGKKSKKKNAPAK